jgi:hypothetical protein
LVLLGINLNVEVVMAIKNAIIEGTTLGVEDHGIFTAMISLDYGDSGHQGFGGYAFDEWQEEKKKRVGVGFGIDFIRSVLETLEVETWEDLIGTHCRVDSEHCKVHKIGHILKDKWFDPAQETP